MKFRTILAILAMPLAIAACSAAQNATPQTNTSASFETATSTVPTPPTSTVPAPPTSTVPAPLKGFEWSVVAQVDRPTMIGAPAGDTRVFVTEQGGVVQVVLPDGTVSTFLDLTDRVRQESGEQGLLGLAFHPDFSENGRFFVYYTENSAGSRRVSEFSVSSSSANVADVDSERVLLQLEQPGEQLYHYAGMLQFGPDGYLWVSSGDAGQGSAWVRSADLATRSLPQDPTSLFGKILRLDVDSGEPYGIPPTNPNADGVAGSAEVWGYGLRNPWRFDIDPVRRVIVIGDVGEYEREEVTVASIDEPGPNFGWPLLEGTHCVVAVACEDSSLLSPVAEYSHDNGCAVTGGITYRGKAIPELYGRYFYSDRCPPGWIRSFIVTEDGISEHEDRVQAFGSIAHINVFGTDGDGEIIIGLHDSGEIWRLVPIR
jgi:glucose/arabinose dehydrogenase